MLPEMLRNGGTTTDVREGRRALVYENVRDVIFSLGLDGDRFRFLEINHAFTVATGLDEANVVGKFVDEVIPEPSLSLVLKNYRTAIREKRTVRWEEVTDFPSGRRRGQVSITPMLEADGRCISLVGTVHDITAEARVRALNEAEQRVLELVASGASLVASLTALVEAIEEEAPPALASILLVSADGKQLVHGTAPHLPEAFNQRVEGLVIGDSAGSCGTAAALKRQVIATDIATDPLWRDVRHHALEHGLRACWSTPICSRDARVLGTFALYYRDARSPTQDDLDLIARTVHVAGIAIQRHELDEQLRALSVGLEAAREEERAGIAREIHDQLGQSLTVFKMDLAFIARRASSPTGIETAVLLQKVRDLSAMTDEIIGEVRRISAELRPAVLDDLGLVAALTWQTQEFEKRTGIPCVVELKVADESAFRGELATTVFRVLQEALTNVVRHAEAQQVEVRLREDDGSLFLEVRDDGKGFFPETINARQSLGLLGMRERARRLGGDVVVSSPDGGGTLVRFRVPAPPR
jgi:PAS domain S-box-containing protein